MLKHVLSPSAFLTCAALLAGCDVVPTANCTQELRIALTPLDTTVRLGASFQAAVRLSSCGGSKQLSDRFAWTAADPAIVAVHVATGRVTALAAGETRVEVRGQYYGPLGSIRVVVQEPVR